MGQLYTVMGPADLLPFPAPQVGYTPAVTIRLQLGDAAEVQEAVYGYFDIMTHSHCDHLGHCNGDIVEGVGRWGGGR